MYILVYSVNPYDKKKRGGRGLGSPARGLFKISKEKEKVLYLAEFRPGLVLFPAFHRLATLHSDRPWSIRHLSGF